MQALILIELDDEHLAKETNDLYDRLHGYKCKLMPMPKKTGQKPYCRTKQECVNLGWDACLEEIEK